MQDALEALEGDIFLVILGGAHNFLLETRRDLLGIAAVEERVVCENHTHSTEQTVITDQDERDLLLPAVLLEHLLKLGDSHVPLPRKHAGLDHGVNLRRRKADDCRTEGHDGWKARLMLCVKL